MSDKAITPTPADVTSILAGWKTQIRFPVHPQPILSATSPSVWNGWSAPESTLREDMIRHCPYGRVGDQLVMLESAWLWCERFRSPGKEMKGLIFTKAKPRELPGALKYLADNPVKPDNEIDHPKTRNSWGWVRFSPDKLPAWAVRATLEIAEVRIQRLQEMNGAEVFSECGFDPNGTYVSEFGWEIDAMQRYWDAARPRDSKFRWAANPWVYVLTFRAIINPRISQQHPHANAVAR